MSAESRMEREDYLYARIGQAISTWAWVEYHLVSHFEHALKISRRRAIHILDPVLNFSLSLQIIDAANRDALHKCPELIYWSTLADYVRELSGDRNMLAHYPVQTPYTSEYLETDPEPFVGPTDEDYSPKQAKRQALPLTEVEELIEDFSWAAVLLADFSRWRYSSHPLPEKFSLPIERVRPTRAERRAQRQKKRKLPPRSSEG